MKKVIFIVTVVLISLGVKAQGTEFSVGADVVSSYVWRGSQLSGASVQPSLDFSTGDFSISAWGSADIDGNFKEVDLSASYSVSGLTILFTDYWASAGKYYVYDSHKTDHSFEASLAYTLPESFPLSISWNTMIAGADLYKSNGDRAYSTYIEFGYPLTVNDVSLELTTGLTPWESAYAYASDFSIINVSLKASKEIKITDSFSLPVFGQLITNPHAEETFFVFGVGF